MPAEKATALVLHVIDFSETSVVVTLFTREFGKIHGLAKGARRPKSPFESALDLLSLCRIVFLAKSSDALDLVTEAKLERRFRAAGRDLSSLYAAYYVAELLNDMTDDGDPHPELFDAACDTLAALGREGANVAALVLRLELSALRYLGHLPSLDACVECGAPVKSEGRVAFGLLAGGVLCVKCRPGKKQVVSLSARALDLARQFAAPHWASAPDIDRKAYGELRGVLNQYLCNLLGHRPRMHSYLGVLSG
jgi:DNA repair protein RecO (recombination protein O)